MNAAYAHSPSSRRRASLSLIPAAVLLCASLLELCSVARSGGDVPSDSDWRAGFEWVNSTRAPTDLVVAAPGWLDPRMRQFAAGAVSIEAATRMDRERFSDLWVMSARGAKAPESRGLAVAASKTFGALRVTRYSHEPARVTTDFVAEFAKAQVSGLWRARPRVAIDEVGFSPHRCVRGELRPNAHAAIVYRDVPLGSTLVGYVGLADVFTRREIRSPLELSITVDGDERALLSAGVDDGWVRFEIDTRDLDRATVGFHPRASEAKRLFCFAAEARQ